MPMLYIFCSSTSGLKCHGRSVGYQRRFGLLHFYVSCAELAQPAQTATVVGIYRFEEPCLYLLRHPCGADTFEMSRCFNLDQCAGARIL